MAILATVTMLFGAFTAAVIVRRTGSDWLPVVLPPFVWINTAVLLTSSAALERARGLWRRGATKPSVNWLVITWVLGFLFLAGQVLTWRMLAARGVFVPTSPHAAFFYLLSAVHGAHVVGGLGALAWILRHAKTGADDDDGRDDGLRHGAIYWHFVGGVWIYLLIMLTVL